MAPGGTISDYTRPRTTLLIDNGTFIDNPAPPRSSLEPPTRRPSTRHSTPTPRSRASTPPATLSLSNHSLTQPLHQSSATKRSYARKSVWWKLKTSNLLLGGWLALFVGWSLAAPGFLVSCVTTLQAFAMFSSDVGSAVGTVAGAGANVTEAVSFLFTNAVRSSSTLAGDAWSGVDLLAVHSVARRGEMYTDDLAELWTWLNSSEGRSTLEWPSSVLNATRPLSEVLSSQRPLISISRDEFNVNGSYMAYTIRLAVLPSNWISVRWSFATATFAPQWVNPLWDLMLINVSAENLQIQRRLQDHFKFSQLLDELNLTRDLQYIPTLKFRPWFHCVWPFGGFWIPLVPSLPPHLRTLGGYGIRIFSFLVCFGAAWAARCDPSRLPTFLNLHIPAII